MRSPPRPPASPRLETERLVLRMADERDVEAIVRYYCQNREFLKPFDPLRPESFFTERFWTDQVGRSLTDWRMDRALRLFLFTSGEAEIVGTVNFTRIQRGVSHSCTLGYGLSERHQGQGFMTEALGAAIDYVFENARLHRIEANYMPHNGRSGRLLRRLGFSVDGYARDFLLIEGRWEDHVLTSILNPGWSSADDL